MNVDQLKKQARSLQKAYPALVAENGDQLSYAEALKTVALVNGFPSWEALCARHPRDGGSPVMRLPGPSAEPELGIDGRLSAWDLVKQKLTFDVEAKPTRRPTVLSEEGRPKAFGSVHYAVLRIRDEDDKARIETEVSELEHHRIKLSPRAILGIPRPGLLSQYEGVESDRLGKYMRHMRESLARVPFNLENQARYAFTSSQLGGIDFAVEELRPIVDAAIQMLPRLPLGRVLQIPGAHPRRKYAVNDPFLLLLHTYIVLVHRQGDDEEANRLAKLGNDFCPYNRFGFRYLLSRKCRESELFY